jgi:ABC-2 type transport system permease protein
MILRGLWKLTSIEIKIFLREPLGAFGTIGFSFSSRGVE